MGLDISAYEHVKLFKAQPEGWDSALTDRDDLRVFYQAESCPDRSDGLVRGYYEISGDGGHIGFSYSGYNEWREWFCRTFIGVRPGEVWDDPEAYADRPFVELVNYADNEGFFGPKTCAKLAADFAAHTPGHHAFGLRDHARAYEKLAQMFRIAGGGGAVRFH